MFFEDENCIKLVQNGVHKDLLNFLPLAKQRPVSCICVFVDSIQLYRCVFITFVSYLFQEPFKYIQAVFGALKNLALPSKCFFFAVVVPIVEYV